MKKGKVMDILVTCLFVSALVILYFFWKCKWDPIITLIAGIILVVTGFISYKQYKKLNELEKAQKEEQEKE